MTDSNSESSAPGHGIALRPDVPGEDVGPGHGRARRSQRSTEARAVAGHARFDLRPFLPPATVALAVVVAGVVIMSYARRQYFFGDDWDFLLYRDLSWHGLMTPHGEHWVALPIVAFRAMVALFGVDHYSAYALMPVVVHIAVCALLYLVLRRNGVRGWPAAVVVIPFAFLCGNLGENLLWDFQICFLGAGAFGLVSVLIASGDKGARPSRVGLVWLTSVGALMCSGAGVAMLAWLGCYVLLRRGLVKALLVTVPPGLVYLAWYVVYDQTARTDELNSTGQQYAQFVTSGLSNLWQQVLRLSGVGGVTFLVLLAVGVLVRPGSRERVLGLSGVVAAVVFYLFTALGRAGTGPGGGVASRYAYFGVLFTLPAAAMACGLVGRRLAGRRVELTALGTVVTLLLVANGAIQLGSFSTARQVITGDLEPRLQSTRVLVSQRATLLNDQVSPRFTPGLTVAKVEAAFRQGLLPSRPVSRRAVFDMAAELQVAARRSAFSLPLATALRTHALASPPIAGRCVDTTAGAGAIIDLPAVDGGSQVAITTSAHELTGRLVDGRRSSPVVTLETEPNRRAYVASTASGGDLRIFLPQGPLSICL